MAQGAIAKIANIISTQNNDISTIKQNISPDDPEASFPIFFNYGLKVTGTMSLYQRRMEGVYIVGHPTYGMIGSFYLNPDMGTVLALDLTEQPVASVVTDESPESNDGELRINATAYYPFNGNANDESVNSNDGTVTGATLTTDHLGNANNALLTPSGSGVVNLPASTLLNSDASIFAWIKTTDSGGYIYSNRDNTNGGLSLYIDGGRLNLFQKISSSTNSTSTVNTGEWVFVCATFNNTTKQVRYFINGVLDRTITAPTITHTLPTGAMLFNRVGGGFSTTHIVGGMSMLGIVPVNLSDAEVLNLYNVTSVHKLDKPLVTKTDSDGNSITGYEFVRLGNTGEGSFIQNSVDTTAINDEISIYAEVEIPAPSIADPRILHAYGTELLFDNFPALRAIGTGGSTFYTLSSNYSQTNNAGENIKILAEYSKSGDFCRGYINGVLQTTTNGVRTDLPSSQATPIRIARYSSGQNYNGVISKPLIFNRVLTSGERTDLFNGKKNYPIGPFCILSHPSWASLNDCILGDRDEDQYERTLIQTVNI